LPEEGKNSPNPPTVLLLDSDYSQMGKVVESIFQTFPFSWNGKKVLIKPNILGPYSPERGITTHPSLIHALVIALRKEGASCIVGDNPGHIGYAANERCARISGILEAAEGSFVNFAKDPVQIKVNSKFMENLVISKSVLEADLVINVPKFKTHLQTRMTGAVKNMFGILVGAEKARVHLSAPKPEDFSEALVDIYQIRLPDLTIMDAVVGIEGNGPSSSDLRTIGKIMASPNGVAVDGLMAAMMGVSPQQVDMLRIASQRGLGEVDPEKMEIQGTWSRLPRYKMPLTFVSRGWFGKAVNRFIYRPLIKPNITVNRDLCIQCQVCIKQCPAQALTMKDFPVLDKEKCISCYCCYELCSSRAIELTGLMRRLGDKKRKKNLDLST
jgi:uncharacterized protein (DUF362 family)/NAD-dependent dihydropyrimidine dehydrogenase PreA subunit